MELVIPLPRFKGAASLTFTPSVLYAACAEQEERSPEQLKSLVAAAGGEVADEVPRSAALSKGSNGPPPNNVLVFSGSSDKSWCRSHLRFLLPPSVSAPPSIQIKGCMNPTCLLSTQCTTLADRTRELFIFFYFLKGNERCAKCVSIGELGCGGWEQLSNVAATFKLFRVYRERSKYPDIYLGFCVI
jgi:hypothetical protein